MEPAILEIAGFVVFSRQHTKFTKMPKKFVALSVALYSWSCYLICHKKTKVIFLPSSPSRCVLDSVLFDERNLFLVEGKPL